MYVDVGYLLAAAATRVTGSSLRRGVQTDYAALIEALQAQAEADSGLPLLRVNWYDAGGRPGGMPDLSQDEIGLLSRVKLRLGRLSYTGEQKGVDVRIGLDLAIQARQRVADVVYLVSGDDDLTEAVEEAQGHGVQVVLLVVPRNDGRPLAVAKHLAREVDRTIVIDPETIDSAIRPTALPEALIPDSLFDEEHGPESGDPNVASPDDPAQLPGSEGQQPIEPVASQETGTTHAASSESRDPSDHTALADPSTDSASDGTHGEAPRRRRVTRILHRGHPVEPADGAAAGHFGETADSASPGHSGSAESSPAAPSSAEPSSAAPQPETQTEMSPPGASPSGVSPSGVSPSSATPGSAPARSSEGADVPGSMVPVVPTTPGWPRPGAGPAFGGSSRAAVPDSAGVESSSTAPTAAGGEPRPARASGTQTPVSPEAADTSNGTTQLSDRMESAAAPPHQSSGESPHIEESTNETAGSLPSPALFARRKAAGLALPGSTLEPVAPGPAEELTIALADGVARQVVAAWCSSATPDALVDLRRAAPTIPAELDRALLVDLSSRADGVDLTDQDRQYVRARFWYHVGRVRPV